mgnify:CR=1 FL=1
MTNPSVIRGLICEFLRACPDVLALLSTGNPADVVQEYVDEANGDYFGSVADLGTGRVLVAAHGWEPGGAQMARYVQRFSIVLKPKGDPALLASTIMNAKTSASGFDPDRSFVDSTIHPNYDPTVIPSFDRRTIRVDNNSNFDYWELNLAYASRGRG